MFAISKSRAQQPQKIKSDVPANTTASHRKKKCANFMAELWKPIIQYAIVACEEIKVQLVLQFGVSRGLREVLLAPVGRVYLSEVVSKFEPKPGPRCRDSETQMVAYAPPAVK